ncbi:MAG: glutathione synthase [Alphaproteobacteria bacterium]|jgi:glutathione synthase
MTRSILFIIDSLDTLNAAKDSSLLMMHAFQKKGDLVFICTLEELAFSVKQGAYADVQSLKLYDNYHARPNIHDFIAEINPEITQPLNNFAMIFMRKDPPVNEAYLNALKILNLVDKNKVDLVNPADHLQTLNEKLFAFEFPDLIPDACYTINQSQALAFAQNHTKVILKPIDGMGGKGIFISDAHDPNFAVIFETLSQNFTQSVLIQEFIPAITEGDKRILIVNGHIFDHALARIPKTGQIRGNLAAGGHYKALPLSDSDYKIANIVAQRLKADHIRICGIDVIGDKLTEINITSPTCFRQLYTLTGRNPFDLFFQKT